jgi:hypothetical protein
VDHSRPVATAYAYELRHGVTIVSTGRLMAEGEVLVGEEVTVAGVLAHVNEIVWADGERRLLLESGQAESLQP